MTILPPSAVRVGARAADRTDAIRQVGGLLVESGFAAAAYVDGMLARERIVSTYLGNGVAIPHGEDAGRRHIHRTGLAVLQLPDGVEWEPGERAYLVIGIAANSDEHIDVLSRLADAIEDPDAAGLLARTSDPGVIVERLTGRRDDMEGAARPVDAS